MSCEIIVRQCERCDLTEGMVLCQECAGKEESDPVCYCVTCSELVHKGRIAKHTLTLLESGVSQVTKDEAESLITKYKREVACLSKKIDEVDKAKENVCEFMQKHDKTIRQTITTVVRQLQERGKSFIQQVAVRSNEKKEQLTAIQAQLQDAQKDISEQIGNLEEILKKLDTKDKAEIASIDATLRDIEAEVQGKIDETFKSVKLPELDTEFGIDTSCMSEAVQALQINIHPEPSDEVIAERNDIEVPDLKISQVVDAEKAEIEAFVSGSLTRNGLFWAVPRFSKEVEAKLFRLSMLIRKMYIENATWKSFGDSGTQPIVGGDVYALYDADHKWYRGRVEDTKSSRNGSTVRFTDYGNTQNVTHVNILPASDSLAPRCTQQAIRCCLHETLEKPIPNEARWAFSDATGEAALNLTFHKQVTRDGCSAWLVDVKVPLTDGTLQDVNAIVMDKVIEDSQPKSTIMCKDIRYTNMSPSSGTGMPGWAKGSDALMSTAGSSMSRRLASEDQISNLAQISAILGSGGGMRRDCKLDEAEIKRRQKKRERKESKRARKPEASFEHEAAGEQQEIDADKVHTDELDGYLARLGITQSHVLPALGLEQIVPPEGAVDGAQTTANSAGDGDHDRSSTRRDDVNEAIDTTNSIAETQQCTAEAGEEQSKGAPDTVVSVDSSAGGAKAVVVSPADIDIQLITSASPPLDGGVTLSHTESAATSLDSGHTTSLPHGDNTCLPQDGVVSSPKDDATIASTDDCISVPKSDDVAFPQCVAAGPVTSESSVAPLCSDKASTTVIDLGTEAIGEPLYHPGTVCDSAEPVMTVDASLEVTGHVHSVTETLEDNDVAMSQDSVEEPIAGTAAIPSDICCDDVIVPSIPQTDGAADVVGETTPAASDACPSVALEDDRPEREGDMHIGVALVDGDISGDSVKSYRVSPPPPTPPSIRALAQSAGDEPVAIDTDLKQCQLADGDSNVSDSDLSGKSNNMHDDHTKKPDVSEGTANSDSTQRGVVSLDRLAHSSIKPKGCKPKSTAPPIETVLPKAKLYHGGEFQVRVTSELQKNGQFWVELVRDSLAEGAYQHMLSQFKEMANISASVHSVTRGILVLSPGEKDSWHRGRVSEVKGHKVDVCLIDCGRNVSVHMDNLKELYDRFHRIPYQAVMCSIARKDYTQFGEKGRQLFKEKVRGRELLVKVITVGGTGSFVFVDLLDCLGPEPCNIYQLIYDKIPEERPVKQIPRPGAPVQTCVRNGEHGETVVPYPYVTVPVSIQSGMPVSLTMPYQPVPVLGDSSNAEPVRLMPDANPHPKSMAGYIPSMPFYTTSAVYTASNAKYTMPPQLLPPGGMPVDSAACAGTMPPVSYVPVSHHDATGTFCTKATMQGSGDATHNHVTYIPSLLPDGATHQDMHSSQPSSTTGSEIECDDDVWVEEDRKVKQMDKHNWRQRSDHQDRHYHGGGGVQLWGRAKDDIICYGCQKRGHMNRDCPNFNRRPNLMDPPGSWSGKGRDPKRGSRGGGGGGVRGGPRGVDSNRGSASSHRSSGRKHRNSRPSGGRQNYTGDEGGPAVSSGGRMGGRKSSWQAESWED